jgi:hypothetical protein
MSAMKGALVDLALTARQAGDDRLSGKITRADHGRILADIERQMIALGGTWDDLIGLAR